MAEDKVSKSIAGDISSNDGNGPLKLSYLVLLPRLMTVSLYAMTLDQDDEHHLHPASAIVVFAALLGSRVARGFSRNSTAPEASPELAEV